MNARAARTNPFPGLRPFLQEEADLFFGRDRQSDNLVRRLASRRFLAVVGTSGSGKSSLVRAGLLPSLEGGLMAEAGAHWRMASMRPQDDPIGFLARAIVDTGALAHLDIEPPAAVGVVETTLRRSSLGLVEAACLARLEPHDNLLVLVDQFEELFRFADLARQRGAGDEAPAFVKLLLEAARQTTVPLYVVITMRSDFLGDCARFRDLPEAISDSQYLIPRLTRDELQAVITGPIGVRGGRIAASLVQHLLNDVGDDMDQLPTLQHALMRAWDQWQCHDPDARSIDLNDLSEIGGMTEALSRHADEAFAALTSDGDRAIAERLFKCLTERGSDTREIRHPTSLARIAAIADANPADVIRVIDVFRAPGRSFLMPPHDVPLDNESIIDISHESLIRQWRRLRTWVEEEAESRATYLRVVDAARLRQDGKAGLWGEPDLTYARQWQERQRPNAAWAERYGSGFDAAGAFLRDSEAAHAGELEREREHIEAERAAKERELEQAKALAAAQRQRADEYAVARARQRRFSVALVALLALAAGTAIYAWRQRGAAEEKRREAEGQRALALSRQLSLQASNESSRDLGLALLFGAAAYRAAPTQEARQILQQLLTAQPQLRAYLVHHADQVRSVAFSPDGKTLASASSDKTVALWDVAGRALLGKPLTGHRDEVLTVAFNPDGKTLASAGKDGTVFVWDVAGRSLLTRLEGAVGGVSRVAFSPDGKTLASAGEDKIVRLWDLASRSARSFTGHGGFVFDLAFSPDGRMLASASLDKTVILWDVGSGTQSGTLVGHHDRVDRISFSPDGGTLVTAGGDKRLLLWDVRSRTEVGELKNQHGWVTSVVFSPDGKQVATAGEDRAVVLWDLATRQPRGKPFKHQEWVYDLAFSPDGQTLASASVDKTVILWDVASRIPLSESLAGNRLPTSVAFSPDGKTLAAGSDGALILWDVASRTRLGDPITAGAGGVNSVAFSPDSKTVASGTSDGIMTVWDVASRTPLRELLKGRQGEVRRVAFSPDGRTLAATVSGLVTLWDVASGTRRKESLKGKGFGAWSVAFSPDGKTLASTGSSVTLWDLATHQPIGELPGDGASVAFSPDGQTLASADADDVILWNVASRTRRHEPLKGHRGSVWSVAFSPDGKTLASADDVVILWDVGSGKALGEPLKDQGLRVFSLAFSADSKTLAAASMHTAVTLWDLDVTSWVRKACAIANRNLTRKEWAQFVGDDVPYQAPCPEFPMRND